MENLKNQYEKIISTRNNIIEQISDLEENEVVQKYLELCNQDNKLAIYQKDLYKQLKIQEYSNCNHIWIKISNDGFEKNESDYYGCIKCGLDQRAYELENRDLSLIDKRIMCNFMKEYDYQNGIYTNVLCDFDLAKSILLKIKEAHPDIDDNKARKYFEIALDDIRKIKVNEERKISRAKRLSLNPNFNKWD